MENRGIIPRHGSVQCLLVNPTVTAQRGTQHLLQLFPMGIRSFRPPQARHEAMGQPHAVKGRTTFCHARGQTTCHRAMVGDTVGPGNGL